MFDIEFNINPTTEQIQHWVESLEREALQDLSQFWDRWARPVVVEEIARIFATEGYGRWPPLSDKYRQYKERYYPGRRILRRSDRYFKAVTSKGTGNRYIVEPDRMVWGADLNWFSYNFGFPYPVVHEHGSTGRPKIPPRPVFGIAEESDKLQDRMVVALKDYLSKIIRRETRRYFGRR